MIFLSQLKSFNYIFISFLWLGFHIFRLLQFSFRQCQRLLYIEFAMGGSCYGYIRIPVSYHHQQIHFCHRISFVDNMLWHTHLYEICSTNIAYPYAARLGVCQRRRHMAGKLQSFDSSFDHSLFAAF